MTGVLGEAVREWFDARSRAWLSGDGADGADGVWNSVHPAESLDISRRMAMQKRRGAVDRKVISDIRIRIIAREARSHEDYATVQITEVIRYLYELDGRLELEQRMYRHHQLWRMREHHAAELVERRQEGETAASVTERSLPDWTNAALWKSRKIEHPRYVRARAVRYAELWWDRFNPEYIHFDNDCANFVSQAVFAGGLPMIDTGKKETGWWYHHGDKPDFSYSWTVANALAATLRSGGDGIRAEIVANPAELQDGDIIQYDWNGDGRIRHTTIVTGHDRKGDPLVNAHSLNSRKRHYSYEDSEAWTPKTRYLLCRLGD